MLLAFAFLASDNARRTLYVKLNVKRQALKAAEIPRTTIQEAITYFNYLTECRSCGIKPRPPSLDVQRVIDLHKGLHVPEVLWFQCGENAGSTQFVWDAKAVRSAPDFLYRLTRLGGNV
jgi:hypothetical protein